MVKIDKNVTLRTIQKIDQDMEKVLTDEDRKSQAHELGRLMRGEKKVDRMSGSGRCYRDRWADFNGIPVDPGREFKGRILRVFRLGHIIEDEVIDLINKIPGYQVSCQQMTVGRDLFIGHIDGILIWTKPGRSTPTKSLLEIKSCNDKRFSLLKDVGYETWSPAYAAQLQAYMYFIDEVDDAVVAVYNKNTSEIHWERIVQDPAVGEQLVHESSVVTEDSEYPVPRPEQATSQGCKYCKWCDRNKWCWNPATDVRFDP